MEIRVQYLFVKFDVSKQQPLLLALNLRPLEINDLSSLKQSDYGRARFRSQGVVPGTFSLDYIVVVRLPIEEEECLKIAPNLRLSLTCLSLKCRRKNLHPQIKLHRRKKLHRPKKVNLTVDFMFMSTIVL